MVYDVISFYRELEHTFGQAARQATTSILMVDRAGAPLSVNWRHATNHLLSHTITYEARSVAPEALTVYDRIIMRQQLGEVAIALTRESQTANSLPVVLSSEGLTAEAATMRLSELVQDAMVLGSEEAGEYAAHFTSLTLTELREYGMDARTQRVGLGLINLTPRAPGVEWPMQLIVRQQ